MSAQRVLVVDDDESVRALLRMTLPAEEYEVVEATDGDSALAQLDQGLPALVVLDWKMPGRHGALVLEELKRRHPRLPVIVLTAEVKATQRAVAESMHVDAFLTKPFSPLELLGTIERLLAERKPDEAP